MNYDYVTITGFICLTIWDAIRRWYKNKGVMNNLRQAQFDQLLTTVVDLKEEQKSFVSMLDAHTERNRAILKGFIDSMTDVIKISEEDKQTLLNRMVASRLERKK